MRNLTKWKIGALIGILILVGMGTITIRSRNVTNLTGATTTVIKTSKGQPASLWWWKPHCSPISVLYSPVEGEWYSIWNSGWMVGQWLKVAAVGTGPENRIKVYLMGTPQEGKERYFLAEKEDLFKQRKFWPFDHPDEM